MMQSCFGFNFMLVLEKQDREQGQQMFYAVVQLIGAKKEADNFMYRCATPCDNSYCFSIDWSFPPCVVDWPGRQLLVQSTRELLTQFTSLTVYLSIHPPPNFLLVSILIIWFIISRGWCVSDSSSYVVRHNGRSQNARAWNYNASWPINDLTDVQWLSFSLVLLNYFRKRQPRHQRYNQHGRTIHTAQYACEPLSHIHSSPFPLEYFPVTSQASQIAI